MATPHSTVDDGVGIDENDVQGPPQGFTLPLYVGSVLFPAASASGPALTQLDVQVRVAAFESYASHARHPAIHNFEKLIRATVLELADFWFCQGSPYDHVCRARANWREFSSCWRLGDFHTRVELHLLLYTYLLRRVCALEMLLARGYELLNGGLSATDESFKVIVEALVHNWDDILPSVVDWPERGRKRTLMIDHPRLLRALDIVIGGSARANGSSRVPMRFRVERKPMKFEFLPDSTVGQRKPARVEEVVFFSFKDVKEGQKWEAEMVVVAPRNAELICESKEYEL